MTARTTYKPEGWPTADQEPFRVGEYIADYSEPDLEAWRTPCPKVAELIANSKPVEQHAVDLEHEIYDARDIFERLIAEPFASEYANARLVLAYRALKAWEAERG